MDDRTITDRTKDPIGYLTLDRPADLNAVTAAMIAMLVAILVFLSPPAVIAGDMKRLVVMVTMPVPACETHLKYFTAQLVDLGYKTGKNLALTVIQANGDRQFAENELKKVLKAGKPDAVATIATLASQAAITVLKGTDVPIFFFQVSDPVGAGLIAAVGAPTGTNVSGRIFTVPAPVRVDLIMRLVGQTHSGKRPVRFGYIHSDYPSAMGDLRALTAIEKARNDIRFVSHTIAYEKVPEGIPAMLAAADLGIQALSTTVDFWWAPQGPLGELNEYSRMLLDRSPVPVAMGQTLESVRMGALLHITPDLEAGGREAATFVDAMMNGADPGAIPVTPPTAFQLGINLTTALNLNIVIPADILDLAGNHVYR